MLKPPGPTLHKTTRTEITSLFGAAKLILDETPKAISPFGGLASFISFLGSIGFALDLDSTVFCREGKQEGALKGCNPKRKGRNSHHPLLAVLAEAHFILHGWLRSGNTERGARGGAVLAGGAGAPARGDMAAHGAGRQRFLRRRLPGFSGGTRPVLRGGGAVDRLKCPSPKLVPPEDRLAIGGGLI